MTNRHQTNLYSFLGNAVAAVSDQHSLLQIDDSVKVSHFRPNSQITKVHLRAQRTKPVVRPVSLPLGQMLPPCVLNERNSRNVGLSPDKLGKSPVIEEVSETQLLPAVNAGCRLSCYDPQTLKKSWDKQYKQYDMTARTAMIVTNIPQENRTQESVNTCALSTPSNLASSSVNAILPNKPYTVPVRAARTTVEGHAADLNLLAAFRTPRTLQPPPGTFYKPPSNNNVKQNGESSAIKPCAASVLDETPRLAASPVLAQGSLSSSCQHAKQQTTHSEALSPTDLKPTYQRLRPKRMQELEHREAHFV